MELLGHLRELAHRLVVAAELVEFLLEFGRSLLVAGPLGLLDLPLKIPLGLFVFSGKVADLLGHLLGLFGELLHLLGREFALAEAVLEGLDLLVGLIEVSFGEGLEHLLGRAFVLGRFHLAELPLDLRGVAQFLPPFVDRLFHRVEVDQGVLLVGGGLALELVDTGPDVPQERLGILEALFLGLKAGPLDLPPKGVGRLFEPLLHRVDRRRCRRRLAGNRTGHEHQGDQHRGDDHRHRGRPVGLDREPVGDVDPGDRPLRVVDHGPAGGGVAVGHGQPDGTADPLPQVVATVDLNRRLHRRPTGQRRPNHRQDHRQPRSAADPTGRPRQPGGLPGPRRQGDELGHHQRDHGQSQADRKQPDQPGEEHLHRLPPPCGRHLSGDLGHRGGSVGDWTGEKRPGTAQADRL